MTYWIAIRLHRLGLHRLCSLMRPAFDGRADWLYDDIHGIRRPWENA